MLDNNAIFDRCDVTPTDNENLFLPIGGVGEIGMNMYLYGHAGQWIMIDCGIGFNNKNLPGIEILLPNMSFFDDYQQELIGIIVTHGHEDHIGAISYLADKIHCPIYTTSFTAHLIRDKLYHQDDAIIHNIEPNHPFTLGGFTIDVISMSHSIPESHAVYITTAAGNILHSGDWKLDDTPLVGTLPHYARLQQIGDNGLDILICDSTNITKKNHSLSESDVADGLLQSIHHCDQGRIFVTCFASNVARIASIINAAQSAGRYVAIAGRSLQRVYNAAIAHDFIDHDNAPLLSIEDAMALPAEKSLIIVTGSQGEGRSTLAKIARQEHKIIYLKSGDHIFYSSKDIPGNEVAIAKIKNMLAQQRVIIHDNNDKGVIHASGHPSQIELKKLYDIVKPKSFIPIHGEIRHLSAHCDFAYDNGIHHVQMLVNGQICRISDVYLPIIAKIDCPAFAYDNGIILPTHSPSIKQRIKLAWNGVIFISLLHDNIFSLGHVSLHGICITPSQEQELFTYIEEFLQSCDDEQMEKEQFITQSVRAVARKYTTKYCGKTPVIDIHIIDLQTIL